jgi:hypothetical protein
MFFYKSFYIWYNDLQKLWHVQIGYEALGSYKTISGAKQSITKKWDQL